MDNLGDNDKRIFTLRISYIGIVITVLALIAFAVIFSVFWKNETKRDYDGKSYKVILMGDSIFAYFTDENSVGSKLEGLIGEPVFDASFGGTCLAYGDKDGRLDDTRDSMCLAALTRAVMSGDFRYQINAHVSDNATGYYVDRVEKLSKLDYSKAEVLIIENMINDYHNEIEVEAGSDKYNEYTYEGALRSVVKQYKEKYPNLRIVIVSPPVTWYPEDDNNNENTSYVSGYVKDLGQGTALDYKEVQKSIAEEMGVEYLDLSECFPEISGKDRISGEEMNAYSYEGIHPNEEAGTIIAEKIYEYIR